VKLKADRFSLPNPALGARLYAALHRGNAGDVEFYVRACRGRKKLRLLELGSGAGRMALALSRAGHDVTGVELDPALHALALERLEHAQQHGKTRPIQFVQQDMVEYRTREPFDKVLIPYSAFWCLPSVEQKAGCLSGVAELLKPNGELILDVYSADHLHDGSESGIATRTPQPITDKFELTEHEVELSPTERYRVFERNVCWPAEKHTRVEYGLERLVGSEERWLMILEHHYLWRHELSQLLDDAGFETDWGTDDKAYGTAFDSQIVVRCTKV
jgi:SAM-dependent methyltransferase